jgi:hypothetical protein
VQLNSQRYRLVDVGRAPEGPGLYVWYATLLLGRADIASEESLLNVLDGHSSLYTRQRMSIEARLNFDLSWNGAIDPETSDRNTLRTHVRELSVGSREALMHMLLAAQPAFSQPLYIGKAPNGLRQRLQQHKGEFLRLKEELRLHRTVTFKGEDDFAQRAVANGFSEDHLACHVLELDPHAAPSDELGALVSVVETYLNSWATPLLGRR